MVGEIFRRYDPRYGWQVTILYIIAELVQQNTHRAPEPGAFTETPYQEQGYETALSVFGDSALLPNGIVSTDDMFTAGALSALRRCGVRVRPPEAPVGSEPSVLIATHANVGSTVLIGDADDLGLLQVNPADVVQALFTALEELMRGDASVSLRTYVPVTVKMPSPSSASPIRTPRARRTPTGSTSASWRRRCSTTHGSTAARPSSTT